jgi:hypothetical protein
MSDSAGTSTERRKRLLVVTVPRLPMRSTLRECRARAKVVAARQGVRTEPEVVPYDGRPTAGNGPMSDPQGWMFRFPFEPKDEPE